MPNTKQQIANRAESGLPVYPGDVARVSRDKRSVTFRHVWDDNTDARVWDGVKRAAMSLAQRVADKTGKSVEVYAAGGWVVDTVDPVAS